MKIWPFFNQGFEDNVDPKDRRWGLMFISMPYSNRYSIVSETTGYDVILEVIEVYNDQTMSKVSVPYYDTDYKFFDYFNPWVKNNQVHWLSPSTAVDRDNKIKEILK